MATRKPAKKSAPTRAAESETVLEHEESTIPDVNEQTAEILRKAGGDTTIPDEEDEK